MAMGRLALAESPTELSAVILANAHCCPGKFDHTPFFVTPAKAGVQASSRNPRHQSGKHWILAFARMTIVALMAFSTKASLPVSLR
jgi:hypothetical protein